MKILKSRQGKVRKILNLTMKPILRMNLPPNVPENKVHQKTEKGKRFFNLFSVIDECRHRAVREVNGRSNSHQNTGSKQENHETEGNSGMKNNEF